MGTCGSIRNKAFKSLAFISPVIIYIFFTCSHIEFTRGKSENGK